MSMLGLEILLLVFLVAGILYFFNLGEKVFITLIGSIALIASGILFGIGLHIANMMMGKGL